MPRVLNKHRDEIPADAVYVGRGSKWGNPYRIGRDGNREEVIQKYLEYLVREKLVSRVREELQGKDLICFCAPKPCHGYVLLHLANPATGAGGRA